MTSDPREDLIDRLYSVLADPREYDRLVASLSRNYETALALHDDEDAVDGEPTIGAYLKDLMEDFERVASILERLRASGALDFALGQTQRQAARYIVAGPDGIISHIAHRAEERFGLGEGASVFSILADEAAQEAYRMLAASTSQGETGDMLRIVPARDLTGEDVLMLLAPGRSENGQRAIRLNPVHGVNSDAAVDGLRTSFGLSPQETAVLRAVAAGTPLAQLARAKGRSIETVRSQAKSLLRKSGAGSQLDLLRMVASVTAAMARERAISGGVATTADDGQKVDVVTLTDGRNIHLRCFGPAYGYPVFLLHGLVTGTALPPRALSALGNLGIRLICPQRAGYGDTDLHRGPPEAYPDIHAAELREIMSRMGIASTVLAGHFTGIIHAVAAGAILGPERVRAIVSISGTVPTRSHRQFRSMAPWQKMFAYSARYFPAALPVLTSAAMHLLYKGEPETLLRGLYASPEADARLIDDSEISEVLLAGYHESFRQGSSAYERDAILTARDWSHWLEACKAPITYIYGTADPVTGPDHRDAFFEAHPHIRRIELADAGQLIAYSHPDIVFAEIARISRMAS